MPNLDMDLDSLPKVGQGRSSARSADDRKKTKKKKKKRLLGGPSSSPFSSDDSDDDLVVSRTTTAGKNAPPAPPSSLPAASIAAAATAGDVPGHIDPAQALSSLTAQPEPLGFTSDEDEDAEESTRSAQRRQRRQQRQEAARQGGRRQRTPSPTTSLSQADRAPLLNEYKRAFFCRRWPQTALGGALRLAGGDDGTPWYALLLQLLLLLLPVMVGGLFTGLVDDDHLSRRGGALAAGFLLAALAAALQVFAAWQRKHTASQPLGGGVGDEDEVVFEGCCKPSLWAFVVPKKPGSWVESMLVHPVLAGVFEAGALLYLLPSEIEVFHSATAAQVLLFIFGWFAACIAVYPLTVAGPVETNDFRPALWRWLDLRSLYRPVLAAFFLIFHAATRRRAGYADANEYLYILFCFLPLLWFTGLLPQLDALFAYAAEQFHVLVLGGSPQASDRRLALAVVLSTAVYGLALVLLEESSTRATIGWVAAAGFVLSLDLQALAAALRRRLARSSARVGAQDGDSEADGKTAKGKPTNGSSPSAPVPPTSMPSLRRVALYAVFFAGTVVLAVVLFDKENRGLQDTATSRDVMDALLWTAWGLQLLARALQSAHLFGGWLRNPFYPKSMHNEQAFAAAKRRLRPLAYVHRFILTLAPFLVVANVSLHHNNPSGTSNTLVAAGLARAYRWAWQNPSRALFEAALSGALHRHVSSSSWWKEQPLVLQMMILAFGHHRAHELAAKLAFVLRAFVTSWSIKKLRLRFTKAMLLMSALLFPVIAAVVLLATALSAPLLPLFGLPIFLIGFPRPTRFWPHSEGNASPSEDSVYYEQAAPAISAFLSRAASSGALGNVQPGHHFLLRFQNRFVWANVVESGFDHCSVLLKGLELTETSCHTVEATRVEEVFETAFEEARTWQFNHNWTHTLLPREADHVKTYTDTRNTLTGVIDNPDTLNSIGANFYYTLVWVLYRCLPQGKLPAKWRDSPLSRDKSRLSSLMGSFPAAWYNRLRTSVGLRPDKAPPGWTPSAALLDTKAEGAAAPGADSAPGTRAGDEDDPWNVVSLDEMVDTILDDSAGKGGGAGGGSKKATRPSADVLSSHDDSLAPLVLSCHRAIFADAAAATPTQICRVFQGQLPLGVDRNFLDAKLEQIVLRAFRYAVKLGIDQAVYGAPSAADDLEELQDTLSEFDRDWVIAPEGSPAWARGVRELRPSLFSLQRDEEQGGGVFQGHLLSFRPVAVHCGQLNAEAVRGQWASLHLELLYFTNDDDERYSIQAHRELLRNLTVQAADPPLGYPIYASQRIPLILPMVGW